MTAVIIPFPIDQHVYFIRETARVLERRHGDAANRFWKMTCRRLYARLQVQGLAEPDILEEIKAFTNAVHVEMRRAASAEWEATNPRGVA